MKTNKIKRITELSGAILFLAVIGSFVWQSARHQEIKAQVGSNWQCSYPVPVGTPLRQSSEIVDAVYREYKNASGYLKSAISSASGVLSAIGPQKDVCDFSRCYPDTDNISPDFVLGVKPLLFMDWFKFDGLRLTAPMCASQDCVGDPCGVEVMKQSLESLITLKSAIAGSYKNINNLFTEPTETITYDTANKENEIASKTTKQEAVERTTLWAERELEFCSLTEREKGLVSEGKMGDRKLLKCKDAIEQGIYARPKAWSEFCEKECGPGLDEECADCLAKCQGTSFLARINCSMYNEGSCGAKCSGGFNPDCIDCLCPKDSVSTEECLRLVCAGSSDNYVCCYQGELQR